MPAGNWTKCGATKPKANGQWFCMKKKGHHETGSPDNRKHCDTKTSPSHYWKEEANARELS